MLMVRIQADLPGLGQAQVKCPWCPHPIAAHTSYYGGWCSADVTVVNDGPVPYCVSCWCGGTEGTAGPRIVTSRGNDPLVPDGEHWKLAESS